MSNNKIDLQQYSREAGGDTVTVSNETSKTNTPLSLKPIVDQNKNKIDLQQVSYAQRSEQNKVYGKIKEIPPSITENIRSFLISEHQKMLQESFMNNEKRALLTQVITRYITKEKIVLNGLTSQDIVTRILDAVAGLGPLQKLADDDDITEIMVNGKDEVRIERFGREEMTNIRFSSEDELREITMKIVNASGMTLTSAKPYVDCRFPSMRINIADGHISGLGTVITIRKFAPVLRINEKSIIESGQGTKEMVSLLEGLVRGRKNVLIVGPTGSGKTELLKFMVGFIPDDDRTLILEDTAETYLRNIYPSKHLIPMECRFTDDEETTVDYEVLLKNALRQNPNRIIVGESRGPEALLMLEILNTGHPGYSTAHANNAHDAVDRLIMMCLRAGIDLDRQIIGKWVTKVFDYIVFQRKMDDGVRRIVEFIELKDFVDDNVIYTPLYEFEESNVVVENGIVSSIDGKHIQKGYLSTEAVRDILKIGVEKEKILDVVSPEDKELLKL